MQVEQKIKVSVGLSARVVSSITGESKRLGISFADMIRRIADDWEDRRQAEQRNPSGPVLVLDRANGEVRRAR